MRGIPERELRRGAAAMLVVRRALKHEQRGEVNARDNQRHGHREIKHQQLSALAGFVLTLKKVHQILVAADVRRLML